uniref:Ig-like domain-containing protein n=1 Tax=Pundamilia nyererei TaxID=303518 RepID=A0A3B4FQ49_9CICH
MTCYRISITRIGSTMCLVIVMFLWILTISRGDTEVSCVFMTTCILPCTFQGNTRGVYIHWMHLSEGHPLVYLYYGNKDQLRTQDQQFRSRTSLFQDQLSKGNASLQLTGVQVQDEGRYSCYISTINTEKDSFINLKVHTPVKVSIQHAGNRITCSSEGIYPKPELTWSTRPPSKVSFKNTTTVEQTKQQLYNINGSLIASLNESDRVYSCTMSTQRNWRRASLRQLREYDLSYELGNEVESCLLLNTETHALDLHRSTSCVGCSSIPGICSTFFCVVSASVTGSFTETTIPCPSFNTSPTSLIWRFLNRAILEKTGSGSNYTVSKEWKQHVKAVSELGSLTLLGLSSEKEGIYTCEISNVEEMLINYTIIRISQGKGIYVASF